VSNPFIPIQTAEIDWQDNLPFSIQYDDVYYSSASGIEQSLYVFIEGNDLINRWTSLPGNKSETFNIGETGFGTGLNFLLTWKLWEEYAPKSWTLHYFSCEKHPLSLKDLAKCLALWPQLNEQAQQLIKNYPILTPGYHQLSFCNGKVNLTLMLGDAFDCFEQLLICGDSRLEAELRTSYIDAWFLDGFAPAKNEHMWSDSLIKVIAMLSKKGSTLASYTAASKVKSNLCQYGFMVEKKKGFAPKRHRISAYFVQTMLERVARRHTPWHVSTAIKHHTKSAIIIGAGLAGCFTAYSLAKRGWRITLIDELDGVGKWGSANQRAVLFPKLSAYKSPLTQFMLSSFLYAARVYQSLLKNGAIGELNGSLLLACNEKERLAHASLHNWLIHYPELGQLVGMQQASELAGLSLAHTGLFIPLSGWINSPALCQFLASTQGITLVTNSPVNQLVFNNDKWIVNDLKTEVLILANGNKMNQFNQTDHLPLKSIRGQMTVISSTQKSSDLRIPLSGEGHVLPAINGVHSLGATFDSGLNVPQITCQDDESNMGKLKQLASEAIWSDEIVAQWAGMRAATPDYLPLVGNVANAQQFVSLFSGLESNSKRWIAQSGSCYPGLYACAGFGSRGLTTIPLCSEWLAAAINNEISSLPRNLQQAISPARFLRRDIIRGLYSNR